MAFPVEAYDAAIMLQQQGKVDEALESLRNLVAEHPDYALAHAALAKFLSDRGAHREAIEHAQKVCELDPLDSFSYTALSSICQKADDRAAAEEALMTARRMQIAAQGDR